jgi:hypothetical protein
MSQVQVSGASVSPMRPCNFSPLPVLISADRSIGGHSQHHNTCSHTSRLPLLTIKPMNQLQLSLSPRKTVPITFWTPCLGCAPNWNRGS